jgi:hypothetical protein
LKVQEQARIKIYTILAIQTLLYVGKCWTIKGKDKIKITVAEMKFIRQMAKYNK